MRALTPNLLIDAIVRQTMVLIAHLATVSGARTPLAHVANQVFLDLVRELQQAGLGQKIIADMFGMALRTYHERVRRLSESATDRGRSLWEAVFGYLQENESVSRADVLRRFRRDDALMVRGVLSDLVSSGLVFRSGRGDRTTYRAIDANQLHSATRDDDEVASTLVWVAVHHHGPCSLDVLRGAVALPEMELSRHLDRLVADGRIRKEHQGDDHRYATDTCVIPFGEDSGWEAAVFDHYQAVVTAITTKLQLQSHAQPSDVVGGSTYAFDVWPGHPAEEKVLGLLAQVRAQASDLRAELESEHCGARPPDGVRRVTFYVGQTMPLEEEREHE